MDRPVIRNVEVPIPTEPRSAQERALTVLEPAAQHLAEVWIRTVDPKN